MPASAHTDSGDPAAWLRHARADLALAAAAPPEGILLELLAYHAQQAAEKASKAVLLARTGTPPPRTHDVVLLMDLLRDAVGGPPVVGTRNDSSLSGEAGELCLRASDSSSGGPPMSTQTGCSADFDLVLRRNAPARASRTTTARCLKHPREKSGLSPTLRPFTIHDA